MDRFALTGKTAIITGSTRGIGRAIAEAFLVAGAKVVVSSEDAADTARVAAELGCLGIACDVADDAQNGALVAATVAGYGALDIVVANAGITGAAGSWALDDFDRVMAVNLRSMVSLTNHALPHIAGRAGANVVLLSSLSALRGNAAINTYALAKAGVSQLARNLAVQWGPKGVRANAIAPGFIATELSAPLLADEAFMARRMAMTPLRRAGTVEEVADTTRFLASEAAGFITGQTITVDGGTVVTDGS